MEPIVKTKKLQIYPVKSNHVVRPCTSATIKGQQENKNDAFCKTIKTKCPKNANFDNLGENCSHR